MHVGVDLGGTKIEVIALDEAGKEHYRKRVPTPAHDYQSIVRTIADLVQGIERELGVEATVGVGTPGAISPASGMIKNSNTICLIGRYLDRDLGQTLGRSIRMANDADCFTLSEATDGAAAGESVVFGVIMGTGVGGGIVVDGRLLKGPNAITGEWGHNSLPWPDPSELPGRRCYCGLNGCIETFLSGPGLSADHQAATGNKLTGREIVGLAERGEPGAVATMERYEDRLARALANVINLLDPHTIVLGGGLSNIERLYRRVPDLWVRHVFSDRVDTRLVRALHGDSSGVRGAAWLWSARERPGNR